MYAAWSGGLSIGVDEMRAIVQIASRRPAPDAGRSCSIEDADRLTEGAAKRCLKWSRAAAVDVVLAVRAVGGPGGHRDHLAVPVPPCALVTPAVAAIAQVWSTAMV